MGVRFLCVGSWTSPSVWAHLRAVVKVWWCCTVAPAPVQSIRWPGWIVYPSESGQCPGMVKKTTVQIPLNKHNSPQAAAKVKHYISLFLLPFCWKSKLKSKNSFDAILVKTYKFAFLSPVDLQINQKLKSIVTFLLCSPQQHSVLTWISAPTHSPPVCLHGIFITSFPRQLIVLYDYTIRVRAEPHSQHPWGNRTITCDMLWNTPTCFNEPNLN